MAQADAHDGRQAQEQFYVLDGIRQRGRVRRAVGKEDAVRLHGDDIFRRRLRRNYRDVGEKGELAQDVRLHAEVVADDQGRVAPHIAEVVGVLGSDFGGVVLAVQAFPGLGLQDRFLDLQGLVLHVEVGLLVAEFP